MTDAQILAKHYLIAAIWADAPDGTHPHAPAATVAKAERLAWEFLEMIGPDAIAAMEESDYGSHPDCGDDRPWLAAAGHDLWLTSQGHGVGFWDRSELPGELGQQLTAYAERFRGIYPEFYRGWFYLQGSGPLSIKGV
jgi:hypothetical protein